MSIKGNWIEAQIAGAVLGVLGFVFLPRTGLPLYGVILGTVALAWAGHFAVNGWFKRR